MRTTLRVDDELLRRMRVYAAQRDRTLTSVFEEALRRLLAESGVQPDDRRTELPVSTAGGGVQPGVDLDDTAGLTELMDGRVSS